MLLNFKFNITLPELLKKYYTTKNPFSKMDIVTRKWALVSIMENTLNDVPIRNRKHRRRNKRKTH